MDVEGTDRLSSLPNDLIHKVLSFLNITDVIDTSVLSPKWRYIWTSMPYLRFSTKDFSTLSKFSKFVGNFLSHRDNLTKVHSVELSFRGKVSQAFVIRILKYAVSHNVQKLKVMCFPEKDLEFPLSLVSSRSLKHLSLTANNDYRIRGGRIHSYSITLTSTWKLPALTTLDLHFVTLCDDEAKKCVAIFTKCANLKNLTLRNFKSVGSNDLHIFHRRLSNLTLEHGSNVKVVNVVAPQLENLTIRSCQAEYVISAHDLASLIYEGRYPMHLSTDGFHSLEKVDICLSNPKAADAHEIVNLLQQLNNVHFLKLNLEIVEVLSSSMELVLHQPSPFVNLKMLNIYPNRKYLLEQEPKKVAMSTELKSYLLDGSPGCTFILVLREEIAAHKLMAELQVLLKKEKDNIKTNSAHVEREKASVESQPKKMKIDGGMEHIKDHWENLGRHIQLRKEKACLIISKLQRIKDLLTMLPATNMAKMQPCFSSLCEEANIAVSKITDCMKIRCDENQSRSSIYFHELATTLESPP